MKILIVMLTGCLFIMLVAACGDDTRFSNVSDDDDKDIVEATAVELALIKALGKEDFTKDNLATLTRLTVSGGFPGFLIDYDFTLLADCINLMELELSQINIKDLSPLTEFTRLTTLNLSGNKIDDLRPLGGLTDLTELNLSFNKISDISPLTGLVNLQRLILSHNPITDVSPLASLINLQHLDLQHNKIVDIEPLIGLIQLEKLYLNDNMIVDLKPLVDNSGLMNANPVHLEGGFDIRADVVGIGGNPLSEVSKNQHIPALEERGVIVRP